MKCEFTCKVDALNNDEYKKKIRWLNAGVCACLFAIICEILIENYAGMAFAVPMLTMFTAKKRLETCLGYIDCKVTISNNNDKLKATLHDIVIINGESCSEVYEARTTK